MSLQHRPFLTPIWLTVGVGALAFLFALCIVWLWGTADSTTVVVVRHAEKEAGDAPDPKLSSVGTARAELLAATFAQSQAPGRLTAIYVADTARSRATAAPLAARLKLNPRVAAQNNAKALAHQLLHEQRGGRVLIVGQADTIPELVAALSGVRQIPPIAAQDYGVVYVVTVPRIGHANLVRLNY